MLRPALLLALGLALVPPAAAAASCAAPEEPLRLGGQEPVFVGDVVRTSGAGRVAQVRVVDVWQGPDLPPVVVVQGGPLGRGVSSSTERTYDAGTRYAFFASHGEDGGLYDSSCSPTAPVEVHAALDPPGVRPPSADAAPVTDPRGPLTRALPLWLPSWAPFALLLLLPAGALALLVRESR